MEREQWNHRSMGGYMCQLLTVQAEGIMHTRRACKTCVFACCNASASGVGRGANRVCIDSCSSKTGNFCGRREPSHRMRMRWRRICRRVEGRVCPIQLSSARRPPGGLEITTTGFTSARALLMILFLCSEEVSSLGCLDCKAEQQDILGQKYSNHVITYNYKDVRGYTISCGT